MDQNDRLIRAVQSATRKLASSGNFDLLVKDVLAICVEAVGAAGGTIYLHDPTAHRLRFQHVLPSDILDRLPSKDIADDFGLAGEAFMTRQIVTRDFPEKPHDQWNSFERATGVALRTMIASPLMMQDEPPIGVVQLINKTTGQFNETDSAVLDTIASVSTMAYLNFQLTEETTRASTLLGMGKVSHDIGNLAASLYATISYSELAMRGLEDHLKVDPDPTTEGYVETLSPFLDDLRNSVGRIVGYAQLISDISAGRPLRPNKVLAPLSDTIETSAHYLETEGRISRIAIRCHIDRSAPATLHDELYIFRIVQNLVGNAIKAVKETLPDDAYHGEAEIEDQEPLGEVCVRYYFEPSASGPGNHVIEVHDSGPGMPPETIERILSGNARSGWDKGSGSGWGTKIVLELTATHNGKVSIDSKLGEGATFRVTLPHDVG